MGERIPHHTLLPWAPAPMAPITPAAHGDLWALNKQIDELGGEWTFNLFIPRTANFHLSDQPVQFYELLSDFDGVGLAASINGRARQFELPDELVGSVMVDFVAHPSLFNPVDGSIPMPTADETSIGRHVAGVLGLVDRDTLLVRHAWKGWTADGTAMMSRNFFDTYVKSSMLARRWNTGPLAETVTELLTTSSRDTFQKLWMQDRGAVLVREGYSPWRSLRLSTFGTWSLNLEAPAEMLTLTNRAGARIGVVVLMHDQNESLIGDLFVWPPYRHRGLGTVLQAFAAERAIAAGSSSLVAYVWEADAEKGMLRAVTFLESMGFAIDYSSNTEYVARATRALT